MGGVPLQVITYPAADLRQWTQADDSSWHGLVRWYADGTSRLDTFPADQIRPSE